MPELDDPAVVQEARGEAGWNPNEDSAKRTIIGNRVLIECRALYSQGKYREALEKAKFAQQICPSDLNKAEIAKCLAHVGRTVEALAMMNQLSKTDWATRVDVYETLKRFDDAYRACEPDGVNEEPYVLRADLLMKHGRRQEALDVAQKAYWHFLREGNSAPQLTRFFQKVGVRPDETPPIVTKANSEVLAAIDHLIGLSEPNDRASLERLFNRSFYTSTNAQTYKDYAINPDLNGAFDYISLQRNNTMNERCLDLAPNLDKTFITENEVLMKMSPLGSPVHNEYVGFGSDRGKSVTRVLEYTDGQAKLSFLFAPPGKQLTRIIRAWPLPKPSPASASKRPEPSVTTELTQIKALLSKQKFRTAARQLLMTWEHMDEHSMSPAAEYQLMKEKRDLLMRCYVGLKREDVCEFLNVAPIEHIRLYLIYGNRDIDKSFPSGETYMHRLWEVRGDTVDGKTNMYYIEVPNIGTCTVYQTSPRLSSFFKILGPFNYGEVRKVAPLPRDLVDAELFQLPK
jgi:tetratricopeptide (TPR) repeat protein